MYTQFGKWTQSSSKKISLKSENCRDGSGKQSSKTSVDMFMTALCKYMDFILHPVQVLIPYIVTHNHPVTKLAPVQNKPTVRTIIYVCRLHGDMYVCWTTWR